jgi:EAL domain-containing protein (putative c-di-GMP-specific phosphodiesterase class I)
MIGAGTAMSQAHAISLDDIRTALDTGALEFFYQPKVSFVTGRISGGEALIRWRKPDGSYIPPGLFIPIAEESGFISDITTRMFPRLTADYAQMELVQPGLSVAFNVSPRDLERDDLVIAIEQALDLGQVPAACLRVEVTEAAALGGSDRMRELVQRVTRRGVELVMDDFGTGYASLDALRKLQFTELKVDQSIVKDMHKTERAGALVHANVLLAQVLGISAVAEGIETEDIYTALMHSGCQAGQGYWMSRPLPLAGYLELVKSGKSWPASHAGLLRAVLMSHVVELRRVMDWVYSAAKARDASSIQDLPLSHHRRQVFSAWYEGDGQALRKNRAFESMRQPNEILNETYEVIRTKAESGADPKEIGAQLGKLAHYSMVLIADLLRLESELLLEEMKPGSR